MSLNFFFVLAKLIENGNLNEFLKSKYVLDVEYQLMK